MKEFMSIPLNQKEYQPFGDLYLEFPGHENYTNYHRELDIDKCPECQLKLTLRANKL